MRLLEERAGFTLGTADFLLLSAVPSVPSAELSPDDRVVQGARGQAVSEGRRKLLASSHTYSNSSFQVLKPVGNFLEFVS